MVTSFGKFTRALRIKRGELMKDMSKQIQVTPGYLSMVELGERKIPPIWLTRFIKSYNLDEEHTKLLTVIFAVSFLSDRERLILGEAIKSIHAAKTSRHTEGFWNIIMLMIGNDLGDNIGKNRKELIVLLDKSMDW